MNESKENGPAEKRDFRHLFCERYGCPLEQFEEELFQKCLYPRAASIVPLIRWFDATVFRPDFELIKQVSTTASLSELEREYESYRVYCPPTGFWRGTMEVRISGRLLLELGGKLFP